jgi:hypothetical protein
MTKLTVCISGGLGNQMFMIATCLGISMKHGLEYAIQTISSLERGEIKKDTIFRQLTWEEFDGNIPQLVPTHIADGVNAIIEDNQIDIEFKPFDTDSYISGYFQSTKYIDPHREEILEKMICITPDEKQTLERIMVSYREDGKTLVGIHVRRTDYLNLGWQLPIQYYRDAIAQIDDGNCKFIIFTDDKNWCEEMFPGMHIHENEERSYMDMMVMSKMSKIVISNSTFSWWAAYIGDIQTVICPYPWFKSEIYNQNIYQEKWIRVSY